VVTVRKFKIFIVFLDIHGALVNLLAILRNVEMIFPVGCGYNLAQK